MYNLPYFKEQDKETVIQFIHEHPFAFLAGCAADNKPVATQVPVFIDEKEGRLFLSGHIMRQTDHHNAFVKNPNVLCVFSGPHTYVSGSWYSNPHQASTWNYMSVHVKGILKFLDQDGLISVLKKITMHFEGNNSQSPTVFDNLPEDYKNRLMKAIIAFEIEVHEIDNVFKLSQNRDEESFHKIIDKLRNQDSDGQYIAEQMNQRSEKLFKGNGPSDSSKLEP
jgi:transcriptional regulator